MIEIALHRGPSTDQGTLGRWTLPRLACWSLELPDRANRSNRSRIPADAYLLQWVKPRRAFSGFVELYLVNPVRGRFGILVHPATFAGDVELGYRSDLHGCIALGLQWGTIEKQLAIFNSRTAVRLFHEATNRQPCRLTITEA